MPDYTRQIDGSTGAEKLTPVVSDNPNQITGTGGTGGWSLGSPVYSTDNDEFAKARANALSTSKVQGLGLSAVAASATGNIQTGGVMELTDAQWQAVTESGLSLVADTTYVLSITTAGKIQTLAEWAAAATTGATRVVIGTAQSTTKMRLEISDPESVA